MWPFTVLLAVTYLLGLTFWLELFCLFSTALFDREIAWAIFVRMLVLGVVLDAGASVSHTFIRCLAYERAFAVPVAFASP
ncbi:protein UL148C [Panine betaherpesvirus 2]|uniref:Protein UL148C n=1 Tax=Panine betaherpesvirus 2 TaxID=188763 RepID=Q8QRW3_9BETA|nr:protein UL148C [Panine betaherpesvirus 2]AAM00775.1 protein UL148C [Panine betaherpesvirus 2]QXV67889.1 protein UL148C [Panine betaherpesvirus 2]